MKALLLLSLLVLSAAADVDGAPAVADVDGAPAVADVEAPGVADVEAPGVADVEAPVVEQQDYQERFLECPSGWERYKGSCYLYVSSPTSWLNAETNCYLQGASLASAHDDFDYSFLQSLTSRGNSNTAWVGGYFLQGWRWVDQSRFNYNNWDSQTNPASSPCIHLWSQSHRGWSNGNCNIARPFICVRNFEEC